MFDDRPRKHVAQGRAYLELVTTLLQRVRCADPTAGPWEAADLQWWWRTPRRSDDLGQVFWLDDAGVPEAAVIITAWRSGWGCDPIVLPAARERLLAVVWAEATERALGLRGVETLIRDDDEALRELAAASGYRSGDDIGVETWMDAAARPPVAPLADGFRLLDRAGAGDRPHHMIPRSGPAVAARLAETSLYRPDLDLFVEAPAGDVAAYGLFWHDPVTGVGLIEPMRTEERYQRRGLARHLLTAGLARLAAVGAQRLKINYEAGNPAARTLYLGVGFQPAGTSRAYVPPD